MNGVHGLLVSGTEEQLRDFHLRVFMVLNGIDRRANTVRYTCFDEHLEDALNMARQTSVTVQRIDHDDEGNETYLHLVHGTHPGWKSKVKK